MAWALFSVPTAKRTELDAALHDDLLSRQSQTVRDAVSLGGPVGELFVLLEGSSEAVGRAEALLAPLGKRLGPADADPVYLRLKEEQENASSGMGLFFTE